MADYCNVCAEKMGFEPDFDIHVKFKQLDKDHYTTVLCEGCTMVAIANDNGEIKLMNQKQSGWKSEKEFFIENDYI